MSKKLQRVVYRSLRKSGFRRDQIHLQSRFSADLDFEKTDWICFTFFLENQLNIILDDQEIKKATDVEQLVWQLKINRITVKEKNLMALPQKFDA